MPLVKEKEFESKTRLGVWKIDEEIPHLHNLYKPQISDTVYSELKTERRQKEYLASRLTLQHIFQTPLKLGKDKNGRPIDLSSQKHLSLSHTDGWAAAITSDIAVGIDIENYREKILRVAHKFHSEKEARLFETMDSIKALSLLWSAKESVFKRFSNLHLAFLEEMELTSELHFEEGELLIKVEKAGQKEMVSVYYEMKPDYVLTWTF